VQKLHLVGVNLTRDGLIFTDRRGADAAAFLLPVDTVLAALLADLVGDEHDRAAPDRPPSHRPPGSARRRNRSLRAR